MLLSLLLLLSLSLTGCGGGGSTPSATDSATYSMTGSAQKGPLIFGSNIWVSELDQNLNPNGKTYMAQTNDDLGNFTIGTNVGSNLVEIVADGYFLDETTGGLSSGKMSLRAVADLNIDNSPTVNILTTIQAPRLKELMKVTSYSAALSRSQTEILNMFGIASSTVENLNGLYAMQINGDGDPDSVLLATSAIMMQMSTTEAASTGASKAAELSFFVSQMGRDLSTDGELDDAIIGAKLATAATNINLSNVRSNVETYYQNRGVTLTAPKFEEWIDKDDSGYIPRRLIESTLQTFTNQTDLIYSSAVNSNDVSVSVGTGLRVPVSIDSGSWSIVKNGTAVSGQYTTAENTDTLRVKGTSGSWGVTNSVNLSVGSDTLGFSATTKDLILSLWEGTTTGDECGSTEDTSDKQYFAIPFTTDTQDFSSNATYDVSYLALGIRQAGAGNGPKTPSSVTIQTDNSGVPSGTVVVSGTVGGYGLDGTGSYVVDTDGNQYDTRGTIGLNVFLSNPGTTLTANTNYWVVLGYSANTIVMFSGCGIDQSPSPIFSDMKDSADGSTWSSMPGISQMPRLGLFR
jgi:predicted small lipoprotein YifL